MGIKCNLQKSNGKNVFPIIVTMGILLEQTIFDTDICHSGHPSHGGGRKAFEVITST
jgi:hypothetical protein